MIPSISEKDKKMTLEAIDWFFVGKDGKYHLREDALKEIKEHYIRMRKIYKEF